MCDLYRNQLNCKNVMTVCVVLLVKQVVKLNLIESHSL